MINSKKILAIITTTFTVLSLTACSSPKNTTTNSNEVLNFGIMGSVDAVPLVIAKEKGYFEEEGIEVNIETFKNSKDRDAAFQGETLDGVIADEVAISLYQNADFDVKITGITDGDFMLIAGADSGIKSVSDLKGKSVAISEKTAIEYTLDNILEKNSIETSAIEKSIVPPIPTRLEMLRSNNVDAALLPEPFSSLALANGGILLGSASSLATYPSVTAFKQEALDTKEDEIKGFYKAYNKAVDYINNTPISELEDIIIETVGYPDDMRGNIVLPTFTKNTLPSESELKAAIEWCEKNELITKSLSPSDLTNDIGVK